MLGVNKIYYPSAGGAFRIFLSENGNNISIIDFDNAFSELERKFIIECAPRLGFKNNVNPLTLQNFKTPQICLEWYNLDDNFFNVINTFNGNIIDISGHPISLNQLKRAAQATPKIRNKNNFYQMINDISSNYLVKDWKFEKNINELLKRKQFKFPFIIKSCQGKGGKGNLVCYSQKDIEQVQNIFFSDLFAQKQEIHTYNISDEIIIESFFQNCSSYNLSFYCDINGNMMFANISEQIIDEVFYRGNIYPARLNQEQYNHIKMIGTDFSQYISKRFQYIGWIGLDFINVQGKIFVIEANPRVNSVTHAHKLAKGNPFIIRLMQYKSKDSIDIAFKNFHFDKSTAMGIIPYQLPNQNELLLMSVSNSIELAIENLDKFAKKTKLLPVSQQVINNFSKSISYYLSKRE